MAIMHGRRWLVALLFAVSASAYGQDAETTIRQASLDFNLAYENDELEKYFGYYADDVTIWLTEGRVSLEDYKKEWYALIASGGGVEEARVSDLRVQVGPSGDTAVATYVADVTTRDGNGDTASERAWETDIWFKRGGEWKIAHLHYTTRPAE